MYVYIYICICYLSIYIYIYIYIYICISYITRLGKSALPDVYTQRSRAHSTQGRAPVL